mgnify:CR=1 FL=1
MLACVVAPAARSHDMSNIVRKRHLLAPRVDAAAQEGPKVAESWGGSPAPVAGLCRHERLHAVTSCCAFANVGGEWALFDGRLSSILD